MDPWEIATITIVSVLFVIAAGIGIRSAGTEGMISVGKAFVFAITNFIPFGLITFGFIADMIGQEYRYSVGSILGIAVIIVNKLLASILEPSFGLPPLTSTGTTDSGGGWCMIPGLESLENRVTPMNFVSSTAILTYYLIFAAQNRPLSQNASIITISVLIPAAQFLSFWLSGCSAYYAQGAVGKFIAIILGIAAGAITYGVISSTFPQSAPFGYGLKNPVNPSSAGWQSSGPVAPPPGIGGPQTGAKCSPANTDDDNAYVCEAYKNGVLVTEKIS
jgi:hypothetical protein